MRIQTPKWFAVFSISGLVILADCYSKFLVRENISGTQSLKVVEGFFRIVHVHNRGVAFGFLSNLSETVQRPILLSIPIIAAVIIFILIHRSRVQISVEIVSFALILGGAFGNWIDRFQFGHVTDFLDFHWRFRYHFPAFNLADSAIVVGCILMIVKEIVTKSRERKILSVKR